MIFILIHDWGQPQKERKTSRIQGLILALDISLKCLNESAATTEEIQ